MKIGFVGVEYFGFKNQFSRIPTSFHGGFGYLTKLICDELVTRGHEVHAFIPAHSYARDVNRSRDLVVGGVNLHLFKSVDITENSLKVMYQRTLEGLGRNPALRDALRGHPLDVYLSEEPSVYSAQAARFSSRQVVVFQDPNDERDAIMTRLAWNQYLSSIDDSTLQPSLQSRMFDRFARQFSPLTLIPLKRLFHIIPSEQVYSEAHFISLKAKRIFGLKYTPKFLPNPVDVPNRIPAKSDRPVIVWLARWDHVKRPDVALEVAKSLPDFEFYIVGTSSDHPVLKLVQNVLAERYSKFKNIHITGFITEAEKNSLLDKAWILLNTSMREGLPMSFLEAGARGMCIVSSVNPDGYSSMFGSHVKDWDFKSVLLRAVEEEWHKTKGLDAYEHMKRTHSTPLVISEHEKILKALSTGQSSLA